MAEVQGTAGNDDLQGTENDDDIFPRGGSDVINGRGAFDTLVYRNAQQGIIANFAGEGSGTLAEGSGATDTFAGIEQIVGTAFGDAFTNNGTSYARYRGLDGVDSYAGSASGTDEIDFRDDPGGVVVDLAAGTAVDGYGNAESFTSIEEVRGSLLADNIRGSDAGNRLRGQDGDDAISGLGGRDIVAGNLGNDRIDGGEGLDFAVFGVAGSAVTVTRGENNRPASAASSEGQDVMTGIERLGFTDGVLAFDNGAGENAGSAYRVYQAAFDRTPDIDGLSFWIRAVDDGASLKSVAKGFIASPEFQEVYGADVPNREYVDRLYENILQREGEQEGIDYWTGLLDGGRADKADVLAGFSESPENIALVAPAVESGIFYL